jgi:hypothetical protein
VERVYIEVHTLDITNELGHVNFSERNDRIIFQKWLTQFWHEKDSRLETLKQSNN